MYLYPAVYLEQQQQQKLRKSLDTEVGRKQIRNENCTCLDSFLPVWANKNVTC